MDSNLHFTILTAPQTDHYPVLFPGFPALFGDHAWPPIEAGGPGNEANHYQYFSTLSDSLRETLVDYSAHVYLQVISGRVYL